MTRDVADAASRLGLAHARRRWGPCPACRVDRMADRRPPIRIAQGWWCNACGAHGDAVDLAAWVMLGRGTAKGDPELRRVFEFLDGSTSRPTADRPPTEPPPPPAAELTAFLRACRPPVEDLEVKEYLRSRGIDPAGASAGAIPTNLGARWWPCRWSRTWRLVVPAFDARGVVRSLHARAVEADRDPKTRWPLGCGASGLVFADQLGRRLLRGERSSGTLIVAEGLIDYLHVSAESGGTAAVIAVESGSESAIRLVRLPPDVRVYVATHADLAGDRYAQAVADALAPHPCRRVPLHLLRRVA